ncbi:MAG: MBL fold metallo-hydrolase [Pseudomonadota bacterium]
MQADPFNRDPSAIYDRPEDLEVPGDMRVRRLTCPNASPMTFTGTQSYIVGTGEVAVIDPGPLREEHLERLLSCLSPGERISHILVTHSHVDHSPGARWLKAKTGAEIFGYGSHRDGMSAVMQRLAASTEIGGGEGGDTSFSPDQKLDEGDRIHGPDWEIVAHHTPGHLSNHLSFTLSGGGVIFTGDTVMGWATTLVSPPEGDMRAFMASLDRLEAAQAHVFLPGHGHPIDEPSRMIRHQRQHRLARASQVLAALEDGPADPETLTRRIYTDVDPALLPAAQRNVLSTLIWQMEEGQVGTEDSFGASVRFMRR